MTGQSGRCPDPEVLAAFVAGTLSEAELKMTADHLRECEDCREIVAEAARVDRETAEPALAVPVPIESRRRISPWWLAVAAAALAGLAYLTFWSPRPTHPA